MYDVVVIGNDLSSQVAALAAAKRGLNTALIRDSGLPSLLTPGGYSFSLDPFPPMGFGSGQAVARFLAEMEIALPQFSSEDNPRLTALQVIMPEQRLDISSDKDQLAEEIGREFPRLGKSRKAFYLACKGGNELVTRLLDHIFQNSPPGDSQLLSYNQEILAAWKWKSKSSSLGSLVSRAGAIRNLVQSMALVSSYLQIDSVTDLAGAYALALPFRLMPLAPGRGAFQVALREHFAHCGMLFDKYSVMRIKARDNITIDLALGDSLEILKTRKLIISANWEKLSLLLAERPFLPVLKSLKAINPRLFPFTLHLGIGTKALPEMLAPYAMIVKGEGIPPWLKEFLFLETSRPGDVARAPVDRQALSATVFSTESPWRMSSESLRESAGYILDRLREFLPFFQENIDYLDLDESISIARQYQEMLNHRYEINGLLPTGLGLGSHRTPRPNVFLAGRMLCPGLGYEGEVLSGMHAANLTMRKEG